MKFKEIDQEIDGIEEIDDGVYRESRDTRRTVAHGLKSLHRELQSATTLAN
jgi:hypothetical protein